MIKEQDEATNEEYQSAGLHESKYVLKLYVAGTGRKSFRAMQNLKKILKEEGLEGHFKLEIIDIYQQPIFAKSGQIVAAPTLIKELPPPLRKLVGDLSDSNKVLAGLDLSPRDRNRGE